MGRVYRAIRAEGGDACWPGAGEEGFLQAVTGSGG